MPTTADFRNGLCLEIEGQLYTIVSFQHVKPGKGGAFVRTKLKSLTHGRVTEKTFNAGVKVKTARVERRNFQFLYDEGETYYFMDESTFETMPISKDLFTGAKWLKAGQQVEVLLHQEQGTILGAELPPSVHLEVTHTEQGVEGNTATKALKPAVVESGAELHVPLFIHTGDIIKVDTREGKYVDRVQKG